MERMMLRYEPDMETKMTHKRSDKVSQILERKSDAYAEFLSATILLKDALETEDMAVAVRLIEQRAAVISVVNDLDREIVRCQKTGLYNEIGEAVRITTAMSEELSEKLRQILSANRDCNAVAVERLSLLRKELLIIHEKEEGIRGYSQVEQIPKFLNVRT
jgi:hypothetical protein